MNGNNISVSTDESGSDSEDYEDFRNNVVLNQKLYDNNCKLPLLPIDNIVRLRDRNDERCHKYEAQLVRWWPSSDGKMSKRLGVAVKRRVGIDGNDNRLPWNPLKNTMRPPNLYEWYNLNDIIPVLEARVRAMEYIALISLPNTARSLNMFRCDESRSPEDTFNWLLMVWIMALLNRPESDNDRSTIGLSWVEVMPSLLSLSRAEKMLTGPRGFAHGWTGTVPDMTPYLLRPEGEQLVYQWPRRWAADTDTNGSSSYCSDSSGRGDSDLDMGPAGVVPGSLPATGLTTDSESDMDDEIFHRNVDIGWDRNVQNLTRFDKYMTRANELRRHRRSVRRARRWVRNNYNPARRNTETVYELQAKRAESLASQLVRELYAKEKRDTYRHKYTQLLRSDCVLRPNMDLPGRAAAMNTAIADLEKQRVCKRVPFPVNYNGYDGDDSESDDSDGLDDDSIEDLSGEPTARVCQTPVMVSRPQSLDVIKTDMSRCEIDRYIAYGNRIREEVFDKWKQCFQRSSIEMELVRWGKTALKMNCWMSTIRSFDEINLVRKNTKL